ncbi:unnamed protein product [Colias eurytheme]|nr:unnamed protein product [Colias eurytheme]
MKANLVERALQISTISTNGPTRTIIHTGKSKSHSRGVFSQCVGGSNWQDLDWASLRETGRSLADKYGVETSTISNIKKNTDSILLNTCKLDSEDKRHQKIMKKPKNELLEDALYCVTDREIEEYLEHSEIEDFIPSDEDVGDPEFQPNERSATPTSSTDSEVEEPVRGRGRRLGRTSVRVRGNRRGRVRGRGRGRNRNLELEVQNNYQDQTSVDNEDNPSTAGSVSSGNWSVREFDPRFPELLQPSYLLIDSTEYTKVDYLKQYIDE